MHENFCKPSRWQNEYTLIWYYKIRTLMYQMREKSEILFLFFSFPGISLSFTTPTANVLGSWASVE